MAGIAALSYHFPRYSIRAEEYVATWGYFRGPGIREKTVAGFDEDEVTLAVAAATRLSLPEDLGHLATASYGGPRLSTTVAEALGLQRCRQADFGGSTNASGEGLLACLDYVESRGKSALLVTGDRPRAAPDDPPEHRLGAAASAVLVSPDGGLQIEDWAAQHEEELGEVTLGADGSRESLGVEVGSGLIRATAANLLAGFRGRVVGYEPDGRYVRRALRGVVDPKQLHGGVVERSGDTGSTSPLLALIEALQGARKGSTLALLTYGGGAALALKMRLAGRLHLPSSPLAALASSRVYLPFARYAQYRGYLSTARSPEVSQGAYVSVPQYLETIAARYRLEGGACIECGTLHFPPRPACVECGTREFSPQPLSGRGTVYANTIIARGSSPSEFQTQQEVVGEYAVVLVELEEGPRIVAQMTDCSPEEVTIGLPVEFVLRRIYRQEGVVRYGFKFRPRAT